MSGHLLVTSSCATCFILVYDERNSELFSRGIYEDGTQRSFFSPELEATRLLAHTASGRYIPHKDALVEQMERLVAELDEMRAIYPYNLSLQAPVRQLPAELLGEIFCHLSLIWEDCFLDDAFLRALFLTCSWWKSVAESTPDIWTNIEVQHRAHDKSGREIEWSQMRIHR